MKSSRTYGYVLCLILLLISCQTPSATTKIPDLSVDENTVITKEQLTAQFTQIQSQPLDESLHLCFDLAEQLRPQTKGDFDETLAFLDDFFILLEKLPKEQQIEVLRYFVAQGSARNRLHYVYNLSLTKDPESFSLFIAMTKSQNDEERLNGAYALGNYNDPEAIAVLGDLLLNDESPTVRYVAAGSLGKIGGEQAIPFLLKALYDDGNAEFVSAPSTGNPVYESAVTALNRITGKSLSLEEWRDSNDPPD